MHFAWNGGTVSSYNPQLHQSSVTVSSVERKEESETRRYREDDGAREGRGRREKER